MQQSGRVGGAGRLAELRGQRGGEDRRSQTVLPAAAQLWPPQRRRDQASARRAHRDPAGLVGPEQGNRFIELADVFAASEASRVGLAQDLCAERRVTTQQVGNRRALRAALIDEIDQLQGDGGEHGKMAQDECAIGGLGGLCGHADRNQ